jgi:hypothetical protein
MQSLVHYKHIDSWGGYIKVIQHYKQEDDGFFVEWKKGLKEWHGKVHLERHHEEDVLEPDEQGNIYLKMDEIVPAYNGKAVVTAISEKIKGPGITLLCLSFTGASSLAYPK